MNPCFLDQKLFSALKFSLVLALVFSSFEFLSFFSRKALVHLFFTNSVSIGIWPLSNLSLFNEATFHNNNNIEIYNRCNCKHHTTEELLSPQTYLQCSGVAASNAAWVSSKNESPSPIRYHQHPSTPAHLFAACVRKLSQIIFFDMTYKNLLSRQATVKHQEERDHLAYTEYQSHCVLWPMETQSPGSSAAVCSPPKGANCPRCLYLVGAKKIKLESKREVMAHS